MYSGQSQMHAAFCKPVPEMLSTGQALQVPRLAGAEEGQTSHKVTRMFSIRWKFLHTDG